MRLLAKALTLGWVVSLALCLWAQTPTPQTPTPHAPTYNLFVSPRQQFLDSSGRPLAGGKLYTYAAGTTTPQVTYNSQDGAQPNTNPIILDAGGTATIYLTTTLYYKLVMYTAQGVEQWSIDNLSGNTPVLVSISSLLPAVGANTIHNAAYEQDWAWSLTGTSNAYGLLIYDSPPSTNTNAQSGLVAIGTSAGSTVDPLRVSAGTNGGFNVDTNGNIVSQGPNGKFIGPFQATNMGGTPQCVEADANGNLIPAGPPPCSGGSGGGGSSPISALTPAVIANTIQNGNYPQVWNWALSGGTNGLQIGETSSGTGTGSLAVINSSSTNVIPLYINTANPNTMLQLGYNGVVGATAGYGSGWRLRNVQPIFSSDQTTADLLGGGYYNNGTWMPTQTAASLLSATGGSFNFYGNTGLTVGSAYSPTNIAYITNAGIIGGNGLSTSGNTTTGSLSVTGNATVGGTLSTGAFNPSTLTVSGNTTLSGPATVNSSLTINNGLLVANNGLQVQSGSNFYGSMGQGSGFKTITFTTCNATTAGPNGSYYCPGTTPNFTNGSMSGNYVVTCMTNTTAGVVNTINVTNLQPAFFSYQFWESGAASSYHATAWCTLASM